MRKAIELAADLCRHFEGFSSKPYLCPANYWTIGYGSTFDATGKRITEHSRYVTKKEADELLHADLARFLAETIRMSPSLASQQPGRVAAILDFVYNLGPGRYRASTLRKRVDAGLWQDVPTELRKWVFGGGKRLPGLIRRREAEIQLIG
jgi:lysozyme